MAKKMKQEVQDYVFKDVKEEVKLSELFGKKDELVLIHNMGSHCTYCTMWADGFNGVLPHLEDRAAFVVVSSDSPALQSKFAKSRNWKFKMVSAEISFAKAMGFFSKGFMPGVSVFQKKGGKIYRVAKDYFGPGDKYCGVWHLFSLLPKGSDKWEPKFKY